MTNSDANTSIELSFADSVLHRIVQILQEALLVGVDVSDVLRQLRVKHSDKEPNVLVLTPQYEAMIKEHHQKMLKEVEDLRAKDDSQQKLFALGVVEDKN